MKDRGCDRCDHPESDHTRRTTVSLMACSRMFWETKVDGGQKREYCLCDGFWPKQVTRAS